MSRLLHQVRFDLLIFRRNPAAAFFTVILPLVFLLLFTTIFGNSEMDNGARVATLYVPGILALAIVSATYMNLAITMVARRERGILKRMRSAPLPRWVFIGSQAVVGFVLTVVMAVLITVIGRVLFDVSLNLASIPALIVTLLVGSATFSALGLALTAIIPSEDAAPAVANAIILPLYFISDVFVIGDGAPAVVTTIANIFPVRHLAHALQDNFDPFVDGAVWPWQHWLVMAAWGVGAAAVAARYFRWTPNR